MIKLDSSALEDIEVSNPQFNRRHYIWAISHLVYPIFDIDGIDGRENPNVVEAPNPSDIDWRVDAVAMEFLYEQLVSRGLDEKFSYYRLELEIRGSDWLSDVDRDCLYDAFKYFYIKDVFERGFWSDFCRRGEAPMEALDLILAAEQVSNGGEYGMN